MEKSLQQYVKDNAKFLKIADGEAVDVVFVSHSVIPNRFKPGEETVNYELRYPEADKSIGWQNGTAGVAKAMAEIKSGELIRISRIGDGAATKYKIISLSKNMDKAKAA